MSVGRFVEQEIRRANVSRSKSLNDIESHMPAGHIYVDEDEVTWAHETTHGLNARMRNKYGHPCFYLLNDVGFGCEKQNFTLREVANKIDPEDRGRSYQLYLIDQQRYWNDTPTYVLDELNAYTNGSIVATELNSSNRLRDSLTRSLEFCRYAIIMGHIAQNKLIAELISEFIIINKKLAEDKINDFAEDYIKLIHMQRRFGVVSFV